MTEQRAIDFNPPAAPAPPEFKGASYVAHLDQDRLHTQLGRIVHFMLERREFWTVAEIRAEMERRYPDVHWPENSIQAQLRNACKPPYSLRKERRRRGGVDGARRALFEFALSTWE
jgi:hypothetical protein